MTATSMRENLSRPLNPKALEALTARGLDPEIVINSGIYTATRAPRGPDGEEPQDKTPIPDINGNIVCYPYWSPEGEELQCKFVARTKRGKTYWQHANRKKHFYGLEVLSDPKVCNGEVPLVIVEGENDRLAVLTAGYPYVLSIPAGGDPAVNPETGEAVPLKPESEIDPANDIKFEFVFNDWELLQGVRNFVLFTDFDAVGERLRVELARRLGRVRCSFTTPPSAEPLVPDRVKVRHGSDETKDIVRPVKDANEILQYLGADVLLGVIESAQQYPLSGLYRLTDFEFRQRVLYSTAIVALEPLIQLYEGMFVVSSGLPGSGKSALWDQIMANAAMIHGWRVCVATLEEDVKPDLQRKLRSFYIQKDHREWTSEDRRKADAWILEHFVFITRDPSGEEEEMVTPEWLVDKVQDAVVRYDINAVILDPVNQLDHNRKGGERSDEYMLRVIRMFKDCCKRFNLVWINIVHPDKNGGRESQKLGKPMQLYDIADGAAWYNACEVGVIVYRKSHKDVQTQVIVEKIKFKGTGKLGDVELTYDREAEMFLNSLNPIGFAD